MCISWSYLYLGKAALVNMKKTTPISSFKENQKLPGKILKKSILNNGSHPPRNKIDENALISNILAYSPKKNKANVIAEYSTL